MMRAMVGGAIPITSRLEESVLATLGEEFDLGPALAAFAAHGAQ